YSEEIRVEDSKAKEELPTTQVGTEEREELKNNTPEIVVAGTIEEPRKIEEKPRLRKVSRLSLNSVQQKQELKKELESYKTEHIERPTNAITQEEFEKVWREYCEVVSSKRKHNLLSHLSMSIPTVNGSIAHVEYPNNIIKIEVERDRSNFLEFIRERLQNYDFDLEITVNDTITKKYVYTDREIYDKMTEINPKLHNFRQELDLDF